MAALGLLVAVFAASGTISVQAVDDGEVGWVSDSGAGIDFVTADVDAEFHINDDALATTKAGSAVVMNVSSGTKYINLATGMAGADSNTATSTTIDFGDTTDYTGADTPLVTDGLPTKVNGSVFVTTEADGGITLLEAVSGDVMVEFQYQTVDDYAGNLRDAVDGQASDGPSGSQRAKVTSTSDPQGEWVTITESGATTNMFSGMVSLSSSASSSGTAGVCTEARVSLDADGGVCEDRGAGDYADGGVWVQDSDTVTVTYYDSSLAVVATDSVTVDTVSPEVSNISPADGTFTRVANPTISFDVTDTGSGIDIQDLEKITLTINGQEASGVSFLSIDDGVRAIYARPTAEWTGYAVDTGDLVAFPITISATDGANNTTTIGGDGDYTIDIDLKRPRVRMADATSKTTVVVTFDESLDSGSVDADGSDFEVTGAAVTGAARMADDEDTPDDETRIVEVTVSDLEPDAKPVVSVVGTVTDHAGNSVDTADDAASKVTASDSIGATITSLDIDSDLVGEDGEVAISLSFDEKLATSGVKVTIHGPSGGAATVSRPNPLAASTTFSVGESATGMYGVSVQVTDLGDNTTNNLMAATETTTGSGDLITLNNGPIGDANFDGVVDGGDITLGDDSVSVASVDASARTVVLSSSYEGDLEVSYHYTAATFQVDVDAPSVSIEPSDGSTVKDQSPFIRLVFDDDEYPGDTNTSVTLDSAMLTMPDGTDKDVTAMFQAGTADNIEFIWAASDLALGGYTLSLSATDAAGNTLETSSEFTVAKRTASISLRPGWNLISIPGSLAPDKRGVNDVFTNGAIDIVLTYDAKKRNWFRATRQADGTLGQPGSSLELSTVTSMTAYWVHSTGVVSQAVDLLGASSQEPPVSIDLVAGWNLIPVRTTEVGSDPVDADSYLSGLNWTRAYGYNNTTQVFESILPGSDATLAENNGYWLYLREAGVLVP